jgi:hypothetical protein
MAHCGFEGTAVNDAFSHPLKALMASLRGPRTSGPLAPELPIRYEESARPGLVTAIPLADVKRSRRQTEDSATESR